ncbi:HAD-IIB family hydrolase [Culicoidibacter larvae]|uniref:HAD-IIB family hydrolase n=1 Tax=Culicoidibacter larvae TaxID=2579976 RepID=A0A5R8QDT8_9FIRM|nr:HAD-IIB family hydrolase [Culicoidibacter larvae]TLG75391.1 HAD-IIB family hydrolase [Culicoidibacter larvae]
MITVFADIDGTFVEMDPVAPEINVRAVRELQAGDNHFVFISGRSMDQIEPMLETNDLDCDIIFGNGAGYKLLGEEPVYRNELSPENYRAAIEVLEAHDAFYHVHTSDGVFLKPPAVFEGHYQRLLEAARARGDEQMLGGIEWKWNYFSNQCKHEEDLVAYFAAHPEIHVFKLETMDADDVKRNAPRAELEALGLYAYSSMPDNLEIVNPDNTKGHAIEHFLEMFPATTSYGIGDGENDLPMFKVVDVAVAMGNAKPEVKAVCQYVTGNCLDGGMGEFIFKHIL